MRTGILVRGYQWKLAPPLALQQRSAVPFMRERTLNNNNNQLFSFVQIEKKPWKKNSGFSLNVFYLDIFRRPTIALLTELIIIALLDKAYMRRQSDVRHDVC